MLLDVPLTRGARLPQLVETGGKLVARIAVLERAGAAVDVLLALRLVLGAP